MDTGVHQGTHEPCALVAGEERRAREIARESACEGRSGGGGGGDKRRRRRRRRRKVYSKLTQ